VPNPTPPPKPGRKRPILFQVWLGRNERRLHVLASARAGLPTTAWARAELLKAARRELRIGVEKENPNV
jgi:hypothetical protein